MERNVTLIVLLGPLPFTVMFESNGLPLNSQVIVALGIAEEMQEMLIGLFNHDRRRLVAFIITGTSASSKFKNVYIF